jgi:hypothetical protein
MPSSWFKVLLHLLESKKRASESTIDCFSNFDAIRVRLAATSSSSSSSHTHTPPKTGFLATVCAALSFDSVCFFPPPFVLDDELHRICDKGRVGAMLTTATGHISRAMVSYPFRAVGAWLAHLPGRLVRRVMSRDKTGSRLLEKASLRPSRPFNLS